MEILYRISKASFLQSNNSLCLLVSEEKIFFKFQPIEMRIVHDDHLFCPIGMKWGNLIDDLPIDASCFLPRLVHLTKRFQRRRFFRKWPTRNKNCLWRPCLLTDRDKIRNLHRGPSIGTSYQVSVHLSKPFQKSRFLEIDQPKTKIAYGDQVY